MNEDNIVCPLCAGKGMVLSKKKKVSDNPYDNSMRRLPLDWFCNHCKNFVTYSHKANYSHGKFMFNVSGKAGDAIDASSKKASVLQSPAPEKTKNRFLKEAKP